MKRILFVDDEPQSQRIVTIKSYMDYYVLELEESGRYEVVVVKGPDEALRQLRSGHFDLAVMDSMMPPGKEFESADTGRGLWTGVALAKKVHSEQPNLPIVLLSQLASHKETFDDVLASVKAVLFKIDVTPENLLELVDGLLPRSCS